MLTNRMIFYSTWGSIRTINLTTTTPQEFSVLCRGSISSDDFTLIFIFNVGNPRNQMLRRLSSIISICCCREDAGKVKERFLASYTSSV